jgi:monothiol glutaredoxin
MSSRALDQAVKDQIEEAIRSNKVVLFMKGNKMFPQCGFSAAVVGILKELEVPFEAKNVLTDAGLREGIKTYSDWPTIPQLYVDGQFVGGCDIVREMHQTGELAKLVGAKPPAAPKPPTITITPAAAKAFAESTEPGADRLRMEIDPAFRVDLFFGAPHASDVEVTAGGVTLLLDPQTARRADGVTIDWVEGEDGGGFQVDNPNAPPRPKALSVQELKAMLDEKKVHLFDVRSEKERATARIEGATPLDDAGKAALEKLPKDAAIAFHCHHGVRSQSAAEHFAQQGYKNLYNVTGGIDAWSRLVDSTVPRY